MNCLELFWVRLYASRVNTMAENGNFLESEITLGGVELEAGFADNDKDCRLTRKMSSKCRGENDRIVKVTKACGTREAIKDRVQHTLLFRSRIAKSEKHTLKQVKFVQCDEPDWRSCNALP